MQLERLPFFNALAGAQTVLLVGAGADSLMRGDEIGLGTPFESRRKTERCV